MILVSLFLIFFHSWFLFNPNLNAEAPQILIKFKLIGALSRLKQILNPGCYQRAEDNFT